VDNQSKPAKRALEAIALSHETLIDLSVKLRFRPEVTDVLQDVYLRLYRSGPTVEGYVDAKLRNGKGICWWLEITWDENTWRVETRVMISNLIIDEGSSDLIRFKDKQAKTLDEFIVVLEQATLELVQSVDSIDLATSHRHCAVGRGSAAT
jgi:hypothetical protein